MDDVLGHVVLAESDVDLRASDGIRAICVLHCLCSHRTNIGTCIRFGEVHGGGPHSAEHFGQIGHFLHFIAVVQQRVNGALGQHGGHGERHV